MSKKRVVYIDCLKGVATLLVVLGHILDGYLQGEMYTQHSSSMSIIYNIIYSFHMPLFFIISGYVFKTAYFDQNNICKKQNVHIQELNIIWLYVIFSWLQVIMKMIFSNSVNHGVDISDLLLIVVKTISPSPYWYLYVLLAFYFFFSSKFANNSNLKKYIPIILLIVSLLSGFIDKQVGTYFEVKRILCYSLYFYIGIMIRSGEMKFIFTKLFCAIAFVISTGALIISQVFDVTARNIPCLNNLIALGISLGIIKLFELMFNNENAKIAKFMSFIGLYSLEIYVIHCFFTAGNRIILPKLHITNFYINIILNFIISSFVPIIFALICKKIGIHGYIFRPATTIYKKKKESKNV